MQVDWWDLTHFPNLALFEKSSDTPVVLFGFPLGFQCYNKWKPFFFNQITVKAKIADTMSSMFIRIDSRIRNWLSKFLSFFVFLLCDQLMSFCTLVLKSITSKCDFLIDIGQKMVGFTMNGIPSSWQTLGTDISHLLHQMDVKPLQQRHHLPSQLLQHLS